MGDSLSQIYVHAVYSTKQRVTSIRHDLLKELWAYTATVLKDNTCAPLAVGGTTNHVHALFALNKTKAISDVMRSVKAGTSKWYTQRTGHIFEWQTGYGAFSVSPSKVEAVKRYIANQEEHHRHRTFEDEMREFYDKYNIPYEERFVWG